MTGIELIAAERQRQIKKEGWTEQHDAQHEDGEPAWLVMYYAMPYSLLHKCPCGEHSFVTPDSMFAETGWPLKWAKRDKKNRLQQLTVAGALIAAEIDRLLRVWR
jgi:hypothetical protein